MAEITSNIRDLKQSHWSGVKIADYRTRDFRTALFGGAEGKTAFYRVAEIDCPLVVGPKDAPLTVSDTDYYWIIIALRERYFWISAAFGRGRELLEIYIDVTAGNDFSDPENPCYKDMYLDLVVNPAGAVKMLDRDELEEAYRARKISREEYEETIRHGDELYTYLTAHADELLSCIRERMNEEREEGS